MIGMSECDERPEYADQWKKLYEAALLEFGPFLLRHKIAEAQVAIGERALELPANRDGNPEKHALEIARATLGDLKRIALDECAT